MRRLRHRLIAAFLVATILPFAATLWMTTALLDRSLGYAMTGELDRASRTLENTVRQMYQHERDALREEALAGRVRSDEYGLADQAAWPESVRAFWDGGDPDRFVLSGTGGDRLNYLRREPAAVRQFTRVLPLQMDTLSLELRRSREQVGVAQGRDLRRGFTLTLLILAAAVWMMSLAPLVFIASRVSRPIQQLTAGLTDFAAGDWNRRVEATSRDEVGHAVEAFNHMAEQLRQNRERLVQLTQMASWQSLARKTAHEVKNSLTPIRLTVEEIVARQPPGGDHAFMQQASQIVVSEIDGLERRIRAFSDFASEPPVTPATLDLNALVQERVALLRPAHAATTFECELAAGGASAFADADLVKGILTNLLKNAAEAALGGIVRATTVVEGDDVACVEVHDSGPGISPEVAATLFEPTITFKKHGMGLGLSIAKKNALLSGGDIVPISGALGGAAFRVTLPRRAPAIHPEVVRTP